MPDHELWMRLDALAAHYQRTHEKAANQLYVGKAVAEQLESDHGAHPLHTRWERKAGSVWFPVRPAREKHWWSQGLRQRACKRDGGHWWHPADPMIEWFCCRCGKSRDGMPQDGT